MRKLIYVALSLLVFTTVASAAESMPAILKSIGEFHQDFDWIRVEKETEANGKLRSGVTAYKLALTDFFALK